MSVYLPVIHVRSPYGHLAARDGLVLCFFMRRSFTEVAPAVWRALQTYKQALPPDALGWYLAPDGDRHALDTQGWEYVRRRMIEKPGYLDCHVDLFESRDTPGSYHFEYHGRRLEDPHYANNEHVTTAVSFSFATEYLLEHGPGHFRALALELGRELPFSFGYASLAFVAPSGSWYSAHDALLEPLSRYLGLDVYHLQATARVIGSGARGAYWLTFLGQPLLGQLGGLEALRSKLPYPELSFQPLEGDRLLLTLGEWPDPIDTRQPVYLPHYTALANLLEPYFPEENIGLTSVLERHNIRSWLRRLCGKSPGG